MRYYKGRWSLIKWYKDVFCWWSEGRRGKKNSKWSVSCFRRKRINASNQIIGYLISGDPGYISSYKDARTKIQKLDRTNIVEILFKKFQEKN